MPRKRKPKRNNTYIVILLVAILVCSVYAELAWGFWSKFFNDLPKAGKLYSWLSGPEGAKCKLYGVEFVSPPWGWDGSGELHPVTEGSGYTMMFNDDFINGVDEVYWERADYYSANIWHDWYKPYTGLYNRKRLKIETEGLVQLENLNQQGDPLGWIGESRATVVDAVQYQPNEFRNLEITEQGGNTQYRLDKTVIMLVPASTHICFSFPPGQHVSHGSTGWEEGSWEAIEVWFELDFTTWWDVTVNYADEDYLSEWDADYWKYNPASPFAFGKQVIWDPEENPDGPYGNAGIPICGWIQGYLENVGPEFDDEIWRIKPDDQYLTEHQGPSALNALTSVTPDLGGRYLSLYDSPGGPELTEAVTSYAAIAGNAKGKDWKVAAVPSYFSITIDNLATYAEGDIVHGWDVYYPAVNIEIRTIWAVYGTFSYLWTVETAKANDYPGWETREYEHVNVPGPFDWLWDIISNPIFQIFLFLFFVLIILVLLAIFAPGMLKVGSALGERAARKIRGPPPAPHWMIPPPAPLGGI